MDSSSVWNDASSSMVVGMKVKHLYNPNLTTVAIATIEGQSWFHQCLAHVCHKNMENTVMITVRTVMRRRSCPARTQDEVKPRKPGEEVRRIFSKLLENMIIAFVDHQTYSRHQPVFEQLLCTIGNHYSRQEVY